MNWIEAKGRIDYGYFLLTKMHEDISKPRSPIEIMRDKSTGYQAKKEEEYRKSIIDILRDIIECKKFIGEDTEGDENLFFEVAGVKFEIIEKPLKEKKKKKAATNPNQLSFLN